MERIPPLPEQKSALHPCFKKFPAGRDRAGEVKLPNALLGATFLVPRSGKWKRFQITAK